MSIFVNRNTGLLTDQQLMHLSLNDRLSEDIISEVVVELRLRDPEFETSVDYRATSSWQENQRKQRMPLTNKCLLMLLPFAFPFLLALKKYTGAEHHAVRPFFIFSLFVPGVWSSFHTSQYLALGETKKCRAYWHYLAMGYLFWGILFIFLASRWPL